MATDKLKYNSASLHELNVGKFLNLFGEDHTMKIGFIVNKSPQDVKIFKHLAMVLTSKYHVKVIKVVTSEDQNRSIKGEHFRYHIREGVHSVPLKNQWDTSDLRGSWAYIEIEMEAVNDTKIDLFSAITYLRKSML